MDAHTDTAPDKRLIDLTAAEFAEMMAAALLRALGREPEPPVEERNFAASSRRYVYGIGGIAQLFNCSMTTANRIKQSGRIDKAISQAGRMIAVDAELALQLMKK